MPKQFDGVPKGAPFYNSGAGPLDEKSWVEHIEDLKTLDESKFKDKQKIYCFEDQSDYQLNKSATPTTELGKWEKKETANVGVSVKRLGDHTYETTFDAIAKPNPAINSYASGGCTSFIRDGKMYRNLDFNYDETAEFKVVTKDFDGMAFIKGLNDGALSLDKIQQLPYHINDGVNRYGIMVSSHILFNDWDYEGAGDKDEDITLLPYYILTNLHSILDINTVLSDYLSNIKIPEALITAKYLMQFMVSDGVTTYAVLPPTSNTGSYVLQDISLLPKLANFRYINKATIQRNDADLQDRPTGIERWNAIEDGATLGDLRFTKAYESPDRLSEFIGINDTTKDSTDAELEAIYNTAHTKYLTRTRNGELWQTCHSVVYSASGMESLYTQENYDKDYISDTKIKGAIIQAGSTTQTVMIPKNKNYVSSYCVDENNDIVVVPTKVIDATATSEGSVIFTLANSVDHNIKCIVVCV